MRASRVVVCYRFIVTGGGVYAERISDKAYYKKK